MNLLGISLQLLPSSPRGPSRRPLPRATYSFRINTCKSVSKQMTLTPFRMNTYEKQGEGGTHLVNTLPTMHPETGEDGPELVIFDVPRHRDRAPTGDRGRGNSSCALSSRR